MKLSWVGMTATALAVGAGPAYAARDTQDSSNGKGHSSVTKRAAELKASAWAALGKGNAARAVQDAEAATALLPNDAGMRALLGRSYLAAGRFRSAETAFSDALALDPALPRAAVSRALAQIALGHPDAARASLVKAEGIATDADIGLAEALLGETEAARRRLDTAARAPGADARTRQNLGLALALEGRWTDAVAIAAQDVPADAMPQRLHRWAMIAQMRADPAMQVGAILGVMPAEDGGQPSTLALVIPPVAPVIVQPETGGMAQAPVPVTPPELIITKVSPLVHIESGVVVTAIHPKLPSLEALVAAKPVDIPAIVLPEFAPANPDPAILAQRAAAISEPVPTIAAQEPIVHQASKATKAEAWAGPPRMRSSNRAITARWANATLPVEAAKHVLPAVTTKVQKARIQLASQISIKPVAARSLGGWAVQLGAFSSHGRREIAWGKLSAKAGFLSAYTPTGSGRKLGKAMLFRLSVSGLATRKEAVNLCVRIKAAGGSCFVRNTRGDEPMRWALRAKPADRA
jgi:Flp pilus assembly protein TadD